MNDQYWVRVRAAAKRLGVKDEATKKWKQKNHVPAKWHYDLLAATAHETQPLAWEELRNPPAREPQAA